MKDLPEVTLDSRVVDNLVTECLFKTGEDTSSAIKVEGIVRNFGFHPERLQSQRDTVAALLAELPDPFRMDGPNAGGGWSFLMMPQDRHERQWGEQINAEALLCLGIGLGLAKYLLPRDLWISMPGGVPYVGVDLSSYPDRP